MSLRLAFVGYRPYLKKKKKKKERKKRKGVLFDLLTSG